MDQRARGRSQGFIGLRVNEAKEKARARRRRARRRRLANERVVLKTAGSGAGFRCEGAVGDSSAVGTGRRGRRVSLSWIFAKFLVGSRIIRNWRKIVPHSVAFPEDLTSLRRLLYYS